jgi:hypothetical protein
MRDGMESYPVGKDYIYHSSVGVFGLMDASDTNVKGSELISYGGFVCVIDWESGVDVLDVLNVNVLNVLQILIVFDNAGGLAGRFEGTRDELKAGKLWGHKEGVVVVVRVKDGSG